MQKKPDALLKSLYQLIIARLDGDKIRSEEYRNRIISLVRKGIGGFILFGGERDEIIVFIDALQSISEFPLFIASDIERGVGQQIIGMTHFPCAMAIASAVNKNTKEDVDMFDNIIRAVAEEAKYIGINMPLIPVLDVNQNPDNPIICTRAFSDSPETVAWFGKRLIDILQMEGLICCAKHFPGHGDTEVDSHIALPVISKSLDDLQKTDLLPFKNAIENNVDAIMVGHLSVPAVDSMPSSISARFINGLLKKELGYEGLIMTDALNMNALDDFGNIPARCLNAGINILLHPKDAGQAVDDILKALESGEIDKDTISAANGYILKAKKKIPHIKKPAIDPAANDLLSKRVIKNSIALIKNESILPLTDFKNCSLIFAGDRGFFESSALRRYFKNSRHISDDADKLQETVVFAVFSSVSAWRGSSGIADSQKQKIRELLETAKKSVVISFGSPYILRHFKNADALIAAYDPAEYYQETVAHLLMGKEQFKGHLPVRLYAV